MKIFRQLTRVRNDLSSVPEMSLVELQHFPKVVYNRRNKHYENAHAVARVIIEKCTVSHSGKINGFSLLWNMNDAFEDFVRDEMRRCLYRRQALSGAVFGKGEKGCKGKMPQNLKVGDEAYKVCSLPSEAAVAEVIRLLR